MHIAILSDVHDHHAHLALFLDYVKNYDIDHIIHLGDMGGPGACIKPLVDIGIPITGIRGNNDGEIRKTMKIFESSDHCEMLRTVFGEIQLDGKKILMSHFDNIADPIAKSGEYNLVLYGHTHTRDLHTIGETIVCNPGAICGNRESASFAVYDTQKHEIEHIELS